MFIIIINIIVKYDNSESAPRDIIHETGELSARWLPSSPLTIIILIIITITIINIIVKYDNSEVARRDIIHETGELAARWLPLSPLIKTPKCALGCDNDATLCR